MRFLRTALVTLVFTVIFGALANANHMFWVKSDTVLVHPDECQEAQAKGHVLLETQYVGGSRGWYRLGENMYQHEFATNSGSPTLYCYRQTQPYSNFN